MLKKIKEFIFEQEKPVVAVSEEELKVINAALAHYCVLCNTGFKSSAGRAAHMAIRHKHG